MGIAFSRVQDDVHQEDILDCILLFTSHIFKFSYTKKLSLRMKDV